jgi:energy-coupling factor transporter ATP-binding protein EcfA2
LLVLDEPTFGQDRRTWVELIALLAELRDAGHGIVAVTHDDDFVSALADRVIQLPGNGLPGNDLPGHDPLGHDPAFVVPGAVS